MTEQQVVVKKQWGKRCLAVIIGGTASAFAAPVVAGVVSSVIIGTVVAGMATGAMGSSLTTIVQNIIDGDDIRQIEYSPRRAEEAFRTALSAFLEATLDPCFKSIQRNMPLNIDVDLTSDLRGDLQALQVLVTDTSKLTMKIQIHVKPRANTKSRLLEDGEAPPPLPSFQRDVKEA